MKETILGISAYYHDSAAAILVDGKVIAATQEERFTRIKHDPSFPSNSIKYVIKEAGICLDEITAVVFYEKPFIKFERLLETYHLFAPKGLASFIMAITVWIKEKLFIKHDIWKKLEAIHGKKFSKKPQLLFSEHHLSHAASAYYPSPFHSAAILTIDGVGEWATTTISHAKGKDITVLKQINFPHSIGLLYSAFTYYCGFKVNSGEYKLMGLAPYGNINSSETKSFIQKIETTLIDLKEDGSLGLNMEYFNFAVGLTMCHDKKWEQLFGLKRREQESELSTSYMNLALAIQVVTEKTVLRLAKTAKAITGEENLVLAGGVSLNCVANGKIIKEKIFENIWIQPAAGDAGGALGAAYAARHIAFEHPKETLDDQESDHMNGSFLGPSFCKNSVNRMCRQYSANYREFESFDELTQLVAKLIAEGNIIGWFQGRMEWGPRALGNRTILGDARHPEMQKRLNLSIKYREGFRPFAPSVLEEDCNQYFELEKSPYMLLVAPVKEEKRKPLPENYENLPLYERLYHVRSEVPAVTHIDFSARIQSVSRKTNERYWKLINELKNKTRCGLIVNTSFNVRGEPIVCSPDDAYRCFMRTEMDWLVIGNKLFKKEDQPRFNDKEAWQKQYTLD